MRQIQRLIVESKGRDNVMPEASGVAEVTFAQALRRSRIEYVEVSKSK